MTNKFVKIGSEIQIMGSGMREQYDVLPVGIYIVRHNPFKGGFYLEETTEMGIPSKLYGDTQRVVDRVMNTFKARDVNTGILLNGEKGSGKTMTLRALSLAAHADGIPTILINQQHCGEDFNAFMANFTTRCVFAFDEFDKVYEDDAQQQILTLLDGVFASTKLFVFTCNNTYKVNQFFLNRPGRMFYNIRFRGISMEAINEYCEDQLNNKRNIQSVQDVARTIDSFNFDMLKGLVEEMNRYNETASQAVQLMNIRPESSGMVQYEVTATKGGKPWDVDDHYDGVKNPLTQPKTHLRLSCDTGKKDEDGDAEWETEHVTLTPQDLSHIDAKSGDIVMKKEGFIFVYKRSNVMDFHYDAF